MLKSIHKPTHLRNFAGQTIGVDAYGWLHRGILSCAIELAQQKPATRHIEFALKQVRMLIHFGVKPYLVFDGDYLPSKAHTEKERAAKRKESKKLGLELLAMKRLPDAHLELQKAVDVTPSMARDLIEELKLLNVPYVVAPYEADSQLAYLEKRGIISGVLSEDSDLLVFGVKCLITKLDQYGECTMVNRNHFTACREVSLVGWTDREFRMMAMLSGCDYLPGIDKMGLKTAYRLVRKHKTIDRVIRSVQFEGKMKVPAGYLEAFDKAEKTFLHQWVFCPEASCLVNLNEVPSGLEVESMPYIGQRVEPGVAAAIADGELDPNTKEHLVVNNKIQRSAAQSTTVQTPSEKPGKPISEFFKPVRTPLAELDPNSFTPSPSQQSLLQNQRGVSWSASQAQAVRPSAISRVSAMSLPSSAPHASRRSVSSQWPDTRRVSPKRQRLCSDSMLSATNETDSEQPTTSSRFFSKHAAQPSPSARKASAQRKKQKDDFELWSDDSALEAVAALTAVPEPAAGSETPSTKKRKKIEVYTDPAPPEVNADGPEPTESTETSQYTVATCANVRTQSQVDEETPMTSFECNESPSKQSVFSHGVDAGFAALKSKFAFQPASPRESTKRTKSTPTTSRTPLQAAERNRVLERLARSAPNPAEEFNRQHQVEEAEFSHEENDVVASSSPILASSRQEPPAEDNIIDDEEWLDMEGRHASSSTVLAVHGSEDLLIPNSPDSVEEDGRTRPKLQLGQFAFSGYS